MGCLELELAGENVKCQWKKVPSVLEQRMN